MDKISRERRSENMRRIRSGNTSPELIVRRMLFGLGYRYRLHAHTLPGKPDLVFHSRKKLIFVHGCFWHQHPSDRCGIVRVPKSAREYWQPKLARNVGRDSENLGKLRDAGWEVLVVWECETKDAAELRRVILNFLGPIRVP